MKIVQSCWSCNRPNLLEFNVGWYASEYNLMSWALSCLQLRKYYNNVTLYADNVSARVLIDTLRLPYNKVICDLDKLNDYPSQLWALPKIYVYSQQNSPFLHVDGDVFIWKAFDDQLLRGGLIAQNLEASTDYYEGIMKNLETSFNYFPPEIIQERKTNNLIYAYNAGILGGNDIAFFKEYTQKAFDFVNRNVENLSKIYAGTFNIFFEQYLFYCLAKKLDKPVNVLIQDVFGDNRYMGFDDFGEVPHNKTYLHLLGTYKIHKIVCEQMANRLRYDYPEYYYRIIALYKNKKTPLQRDYYYSNNESDEKYLLSRYNRLKDSFKKNELEIKRDSIVKKPVLKLFRSKLIKDLIESVQKDPANEGNLKIYKNQLKDAVSFEKKISNLVLNKFVAYSDEYLYGRDISSATYHQYIFEVPEYAYEKRVVADKLVEVVKSIFDWSKISSAKISAQELINFLEYKPTTINYTAVIPEPDSCGYSMIDIDNLDLLILNILKNPKRIADVLDIVKEAFDPIELQESRVEFELLIIGRIKTALKNKLIKAIIE